MGNGIIDPLLKNVSSKKFLRIEPSQLNVFPELKFFKNSSLHPFHLYRLFYFKKRNPNLALKGTKGLIFLHNNWTPSQYKFMSENVFLNQDILLSKLLRKILNIKKI